MESRLAPFVATQRGAVSVPHARLGAEQPGQLATIAADPAVTDILVNGGVVWVDRGHGMQRAPSADMTSAAARDLAITLVGRGGRHIDESTPTADARLAGGIRVHAVLAPLASPAPLISLRLASPHPRDLAALAATGAMTPSIRARLEGLVDVRANVLITGAAGTGKTTLLGAMLARAPATDRIVVIEDVAEVRVEHPHVVSLEARQANIEGAGAIDTARLVREALRMRPDRLVLGECRGAEIRDLLAALNTGHDGGFGTLHANSLADVPTRLDALGALAGLDSIAVARQTTSAIGAIVHLVRVDGQRRVDGIGRFRIDQHGHLAVEVVA